MRRDEAIAGAVSDWFGGNARVLPWRAASEGGRGGRDPYRALVAEFMLQQTQVSRVLEKFGGFMARFPTVMALADAEEDAVLAAWSGLGYYRRARMLHAAARVVRDEYGGRVPEGVAELKRLPGVGRYTAGAIASIVFGQSEAIVDGNVARVLARVDGAEGPVDMARAWTRAEELVARTEKPGEFNEGLMELGAVVCTPRGPRCKVCPLGGVCAARRLGLQDEIPAARVRGARRPLFASAVVALDGRGRVLMEQRGEGLWARMWQVPTMERDEGFASEGEVRARAGARSVERMAEFEFLTTHRAVRFEVYRGNGARAGRGRVWVTREAQHALAVGNAQRRVLEVAGVWSDDRDWCLKTGTGPASKEMR